MSGQFRGLRGLCTLVIVGAYALAGVARGLPGMALHWIRRRLR